MIKYLSSSIVFQEVPDEITLSLEITNCPHFCLECHSPYLREDIGKQLTFEELKYLYEKNPDISCICFMGGDADHEEIYNLAYYIKNELGLKVAFYSGNKEVNPLLIDILDYYKIGPYMKEFGPLNNKNTNQKMYKIINKELNDITFRFWR